MVDMAMDVTTCDHTAFTPRGPSNGQAASATLGDALPVGQTPQLSKACLHSSDLLLEGVRGYWVIISHREIPSQGQG
jgi:hypothetical protein